MRPFICCCDRPAKEFWNRNTSVSSSWDAVCAEHLAPIRELFASTSKGVFRRFCQPSDFFVSRKDAEGAKAQRKAGEASTGLGGCVCLSVGLAFHGAAHFKGSSCGSAAGGEVGVDQLELDLGAVTLDHLQLSASR